MSASLHDQIGIMISPLQLAVSNSLEGTVFSSDFPASTAQKEIICCQTTGQFTTSPGDFQKVTKPTDNKAKKATPTPAGQKEGGDQVEAAHGQGGEAARQALISAKQESLGG